MNSERHPIKTTPQPALPKHFSYDFQNWHFEVTTGPILRSTGALKDKYDTELELPALPDMVYGDNVLRILHKDGFGVEFNTLDALRLVNPHEDLMKVAISEEWKKARSDCKFINEVVKPYDWTYTTKYKGSLLSSDHGAIEVVPTTQSLNIEKLKVREKILFYSEVPLFEDELADNGSSSLSVKIRVMPSGYFILLRFYLRVDGVIVQIYDTRYHYEIENNYILREYSSREKDFSQLKEVPLSVIIDANQIYDYLTIRDSITERLDFPTAVNC